MCTNSDASTAHTTTTSTDPTCADAGTTHTRTADARATHAGSANSSATHAGTTNRRANEHAGSASDDGARIVREQCTIVAGTTRV